MLSHTDPAVLAAGGPVTGGDKDRFLGRYYRANPVRPLEAELGGDPGLPYRLWLYLRENMSPRQHSGMRHLYAMVGANMSFRRGVLERLGGFDELLRGAEEEDICRRLRELPGSPVPWCVDEVVVEHDFVMELSDLVSRARFYGRNTAQLWRKHGGSLTVFPLPLLWLMVLTVCLIRRRLRLAALMLPVVLLPRWSVLAFRRRSAEPVLYAYVQLLQEAGHDIGLIEVLRAGRDAGRQ